MHKTYSIKDEKIFTRVINKGTWQSGNFLSIYVLPNHRNVNFLGLGIGKKVGKAHCRNYVKRLIREAYTHVEDSVSTGYNIVAVWKAKASYDDVTYDGIYKDVYKSLKKAGLLNEKDTNSNN